MLLVSISTKTIFIVELTVLWADRLDIPHQLKKAKYQDLINDALPNSCHAVLFPFEVGCRGFPTTSLRLHPAEGRLHNQSEESYQGDWCSHRDMLNMALSHKIPQLEPFCR